VCCLKPESASAFLRMEGMNEDLWEESPLDFESSFCSRGVGDGDVLEWDAVEHLFEEDIVGDDWGDDFLFDNGSSTNEQLVAQVEPRTESPRELEHSASIDYAKKIITDKRLGKVTECKMIGEWTRAAKTLWLCGYKNGTRSTAKPVKTTAPFEKDGHDKKCQVTIDAGGVRLHFSICMPRCDYPHHGDAVSIKKLKGDGNLVEFRMVHERHFDENPVAVRNDAEAHVLEPMVNEQVKKKTSQRAQLVRERLAGGKKRGNGDTGENGEMAMVLSRDKSWKTDEQNNGYAWIQVPECGVFQVRLSSFIRINSEVKYRYAQESPNALFMFIQKDEKTMLFVWLGRRSEEYLLELCGENAYRFTRTSWRGTVTYTYNFKDLCEHRVYAQDNRERIVSFQKF
jgi:hypothetical protein